ncbi:MAG: hypothetical protein Q4F17_00650 [Eubacteriales bacterium]|nr:hypothetical protein [Eubacteriales bacterium]
MMKVFGIILIVLQVVAVTQGVPGLGEGNIGLAGLAETLGFFLPGIIGVILIVRANSKKKK